MQKEITAKKAPRIIFYTKLQKEIAVKEKSINIREIIKRNHNKRNKKKMELVKVRKNIQKKTLIYLNLPFTRVPN